MKIEAVHVRVQALQRRDPNWETASYKSSEVVGVYVGVQVDGAIGIGASAAHPRTMPEDVLVEAITQRIQPALTATDVDQAWPTLARLEGLPSRARLAADLALHDLFGKLAGVPAEVLWGGPFRDRVKVIRMVGIKEPAALCDSIQPLYDQGLRGFKLKIGRGLSSDVESVRRVRERFGDDLTITVDANAAYDLAGATQLCAELADLKVHCIEQPLPYLDIDAHGRAASRLLGAVDGRPTRPVRRGRRTGGAGRRGGSGLVEADQDGQRRRMHAGDRRMRRARTRRAHRWQRSAGNRRQCADPPRARAFGSGADGRSRRVDGTGRGSPRRRHLRRAMGDE